MRTERSILDQITPDEAHLPPPARTWARILTPRHQPSPILELREPNHGQARGPETKPRHQYAVARGRLWARHLPPAAMDAVDDEARWADEPQGVAAPRTASAWRLVAPGSGLPWEWGRSLRDQLEPHYATEPVRVTGEWDIHGDGDPCTVGYVMPPAHPWDVWADVTGVWCPLCDQTLVWYEAGYVPGYRACMARAGDHAYDPETIRHRWLWHRGVLVLSGEEETR